MEERFSALGACDEPGIFAAHPGTGQKQPRREKRRDAPLRMTVLREEAKRKAPVRMGATEPGRGYYGGGP